MHPAYSVILFTTASGAGYGLAIWLLLSAALGSIPTTSALGFVGLGMAYLLIVGGLLSSTSHLGRPERAWRAFSQWRTSWLSREGVVSVATFVPLTLAALAWVALGRLDGAAAVLAIIACLFALVTVWCTGMIYQSLPTIRAWSNPTVTPIYVLLALASGGVLAHAVLYFFAIKTDVVAWLVAALLAACAVMKLIYWHAIDTAPVKYTAGQATGLGRFGDVRPLDPPHTSPNYIMREMGYAVARKHATRLRRLALLLGFLIPAALILLTAWLPSIAAPLAVAVSVAAMAAGFVTERWLFFAEAQHVVTLFYGARTA